MFHSANFATGLTAVKVRRVLRGALRNKSCLQVFLLIYKHMFSICK